jgi:hypothetical protein
VLAPWFAAGGNIDVFGIQLEKPQKIDKIAFDETQGTQKIEFFVAKTQRTQLLHLVSDLVGERPQRDAFGATFEAIFDLRLGKMVQNYLHHRKFIQICV